MLGILPKEDKFYKMLNDLGKLAYEASHSLKILIDSKDETAITKASEDISLAKTEAKKINQSLTEEACRTLVTPYDREDMQEFASVMYDVPKLIEKIKDRMQTHELKDHNGDFSNFASIICRQAEAMEQVLEELAGKLTTKTIHNKAAVMHELEDQGDNILGEIIERSFRDIEDTRELILRKDLYEMLEDVTDFYRDAANVALRIVLKHS